MANVRICFSKPDKPGDAPIIEISHEAVVAWSEEIIAWEIESTDDRVKTVKIAAEAMVVGGSTKAPRELFPNLPDKTEVVKDIDYITTGSHPRGYALAWGVAPTVANQKDARSVDKYAVYGLDGNGKPVATRDPVIITDPPPIPGIEVPT
jgi:hypothetical protein